MEDSIISNDDSAVHLTIRLIMQGKEVGSIIGKKGEIVKRFREESGAKINISDGTTPERIVTITGTTNNIYKAFSLICQKFEEMDDQFQDVKDRSGVPRPPITLRLIVPASQCGSLIGKGGSKIKEIREVSGASIQVASEMLPNSTERCVTISGTADAITQCIYHICCVMLESPPKGATIPYRPKPQVAGPVILAGGQAYTIQGNYAVPAHDNMGIVGRQLGAANPLAGLAALGLPGLGAAGTGGINTAALAALASSQLRGGNQGRTQPGTGSSPAGHNQQTHEMTVPNELIGCIIGKGGTKIAEIRQISGAMIRISKSDDRESTADRTISISGSPDSVILAQYLINMRQISGAMIRISNSEEREGGNTDRTITISGCADNVALAQYLINMSVELQKVNLESQNAASGNGGSGSSTGGVTGGSGQSSSSGSGQSPSAATATAAAMAASAANSLTAAALPLAQLLAKPGALNALSSLQALGGLSDLLGLTGGLGGATQIQTTGVHRPHNRNTSYGSSRFRNNNADSGDGEGGRVTKTAKFQPY